jgi:hypothetical protein
VYTGINTNDNLQVALEKINTTIENLIIGGGGITSVSVTAGTGIAASVANPTTTPNITITNTAPDQTVVLNSGAGISVTGTYPNFTITNTGAAPTGAALSKVDDVNVTLTLSGSPTTALLAATTLTLGWTGTLADSRIASAATWNGKQDAYTNLTTIGSLANSAGYLYNNGSGVFSYTTPAGGGITSLNGETGASQTFATGTTGTDFGIASASNVHTFNLPIASGTNTGKLSSGDWTTFNNKFNLPALTAGSVLFSNGTTIAQDNANFFWDDSNNRLGIGTATPSYKLDVIGTGVYARFGEASGFNNLQIGTSTSAYVDLYGGAGERKLLIGNGGTGFADIVSYSTNVIRVGNSGTLPALLTTFIPNFTFSAGTNDHTIIDLLPNINITGGTNTLRGVYYHPNNTAGSPTTEIAWENTQGDIIHGNLSGIGTRMVVADTNGKLSTQTIPGGVTGTGTTNEIAYFTGATSIASLPVATYPSLTELSYVKGVTSAIQTQIDAKQNKSIAAYSMLVNNTAASADMTTTNYKTGSGTYSGTITWTGTTAPSGATDHTFRWQWVGNVVTLQVSLFYTVAGSALTQVVFELPSGAPTPSIPSSLSGNSSVLYPGSGHMTGTLTLSANAARSALTTNSTNTGFSLIIAQVSGAYKNAQISVTYFTA